MILDAKATLGVGQQLLRGNPEQLKMVDMALDYLEDDTSRTLGEDPPVFAKHPQAAHRRPD